jgi:Ca-activated chloride channel family protein
VSFAHSWWFLALIAVAALVVGYLLMQRRTRRHTMRFANFELLDKVAPKRPGRVRHLPFAVISVALLMLVIALAGPTAEAKVPRNKATVMLAIDVSLSMESTDVAPDRLTAAKEAATEFVNELTPGVNLGLISFAGIATVLVSPTTEREPVLQAIAGLKLDERTATGEAIISALQTIQNFSKTLGATDKDPVPARIVMMTDGKQTVGRSGTDAAQQAKDAGVPISMIAFGTDHGTITLNGTTVPVPLDTSAMQEIARISGGDFHTAHTAQELRSVYSELGQQIGYTTQRKDVSRTWMAAGTIVLLIGAGLALTMSGRIP